MYVYYNLTIYHLKVIAAKTKKRSLRFRVSIPYNSLKQQFPDEIKQYLWTIFWPSFKR